MPTLNILCTLKNVEVSFRGTSDMNFKKVYRIPEQKKNPPLQNYNAGKDLKTTCM